MSDQPKKYAWMLSEWESFRDPIHDTVEAALDAAARYAVSEGYDPGDAPRANVGEVTTAHDWLRRCKEWLGGRVVEMVEEGLCDDLGAEEYVFELGGKEREALGQVIADFLIARREGADFYGVESYETHDLLDRMVALAEAGVSSHG